MTGSCSTHPRWKTGAAAEDQPLAQLIVDEPERIRRLVDRMEAFSDDAVPTPTAVNIHEVLDRVRALVANGVADGLTIKEKLPESVRLEFYGITGKVYTLESTLDMKTWTRVPLPGLDSMRRAPPCSSAKRRR